MTTDPQESRDAALDRVMAAARRLAEFCDDWMEWRAENREEWDAAEADLQREVEQYGREQRIAMLEAMPCALRLPDEWVAMVARGDCLSGKARVDAPCPRCAELERQRGAQ